MANFSYLWIAQVLRPIGVLNRSTQLRNSKVKYKSIFHKASYPSHGICFRLDFRNKANNGRSRANWPVNLLPWKRGFREPGLRIFCSGKKHTQDQKPVPNVKLVGAEQNIYCAIVFWLKNCQFQQVWGIFAFAVYLGVYYTRKTQRNVPEPWPGPDRAVFLGNTLLPQCLSPLRCINGYRRT